MEAEVYLIGKTDVGILLQFILTKTNCQDDWNWATWPPPDPFAFAQQPPPAWKSAVKPGLKFGEALAIRLREAPPPRGREEPEHTAPQWVLGIVVDQYTKTKTPGKEPMDRERQKETQRAAVWSLPW